MVGEFSRSTLRVGASRGIPHVGSDEGWPSVGLITCLHVWRKLPIGMTLVRVNRYTCDPPPDAITDFSLGF